MNWRAPLIYLVLYVTGSKIPQHLEEIKRLDRLSISDAKEYNKKKLKKLLLHAYNNVPYYNKILTESGAIINGRVNLANFHKIPVLNKEIIAKEFENLKSRDIENRKWHKNTSGGSTGIPLTFIQDKEYEEWNYANKIYYKTFSGQKMGDKELRLWGSERDLLGLKENPSLVRRNWLYNRKELNAFKMAPETMAEYVLVWNKYNPRWVESYTQPIYEFARYIELNKLKIHSPAGIVASAGTLYPEMKQLIEKVFRCVVYNRYGSREVGDIACSCEKNEGLHLSIWNHYIEILDKNLKPVKPGQYGKIYVTALNNYSMPFIRYEIGDIGQRAGGKRCSCGRSMPLISHVEGREMSVFKTKEGKVIPAEFFIHFIGVVYNKGFIHKFQVIQHDYDKIEIKLIVKDKKEFLNYKKEIESALRRAMGKETEIKWTYVDSIPPLKSGKYLYTVSKVK